MLVRDESFVLILSTTIIVFFLLASDFQSCGYAKRALVNRCRLSVGAMLLWTLLALPKGCILQVVTWRSLTPGSTDNPKWFRRSLVSYKLHCHVRGARACTSKECAMATCNLVPCSQKVALRSGRIQTHYHGACGTVQFQPTYLATKYSYVPIARRKEMPRAATFEIARTIEERGVRMTA